ncbi:MAG TPA: methyltransferase domain-containing protein [Gemmatimonadaceae bacterium]
MLTPARRSGREVLDDPATDAALRLRSIGDVTRANRWLGGMQAALYPLRLTFRTLVGRRRTEATLLDVGTGLADIPEAARREAAELGLTLQVFGCDEAPALLEAARARLDAPVAASAIALPFRARSVDVAMCSQLLHHFDFTDARYVLRELDRVAIVRVVVSDIRRSWLPVWGLWLMSFLLRFHPVSRRDGMLSILKGFTPDELGQLVLDATGVRPVVETHAGWRITASWEPSGGFAEHRGGTTGR